MYLQILFSKNSVLRSVWRTESLLTKITIVSSLNESKELEFTKSSLAIWSAANWATKISSAALLLIHTATSTALEMVNRFTNSKVNKILGGPLTLSCSKLIVTSAGCWDEICAGGEWRHRSTITFAEQRSLIFIQDRLKKIIKRHNAYSYHQNTERLKNLSVYSAGQWQNWTIMACLCTYSMDLKSYRAT